MKGDTIREGRKEEGHTLTDIRTMNTVVIGPTKRTMEAPNFQANHQKITVPSLRQNIKKKATSIFLASATGEEVMRIPQQCITT